MTFGDSFRRARDRQLQKNDARRIRTKVHDARVDRTRAARRWPFELLQNAHDAGPREGRQGVAATFKLIGSNLEFVHDGAAFRDVDLAALLSGGSSKDFESDETTGRFGTGFLCTHVLAFRVAVVGLATNEDGLFAFDLELDREGDENALLANMVHSEDQLDGARMVSSMDGMPSVRITYAVDSIGSMTSADEGLLALQEAAPYLFATCARLSQLSIERNGITHEWQRGETIGLTPRNTTQFEVVTMTHRQGGVILEEWKTIAARASDAHTKAIVAIKNTGIEWEIDLPEALPRIFRQFPVYGDHTYALGAVLDGRFDVDQERRGVRLHDDRGALLQEGLRVVPDLVEFAIAEGWKDAHRLAYVGPAPGKVEDASTKVWNESFKVTAIELASRPIVLTRCGLVTAVKPSGQGRHASFIADKVTVDLDTFHRLADECDGLCPPLSSISSAWTRIASAWRDLGIDIDMLSVGTVAQAARGNASRVEQLGVSVDPFVWLNHWFSYLDQVECATGEFRDEWLVSLIPDGSGGLHGVRELASDDKVSDVVKAIGVSLGVKFRSRLLHPEAWVALVDTVTGKSTRISQRLCGSRMTDRSAIEELLALLQKRLPDDSSVDESSRPVVEASISLLSHLWREYGSEGVEIARRVPLAVRSGDVRLWSAKRMMLLPVADWPDAAKPFLPAYPGNRVLIDSYSRIGNEDMASAFVKWGIAHDGLLVTMQRHELSDQELRVIAVNEESVVGCKAADAPMSQIALLEPEILNRCARDAEASHALLGLLLCFVAGEDSSWKTPRRFMLTRDGGDCSVDLFSSLWLVDLLTKPWLLAAREGAVASRPAPELVREVMNPEWVAGNAPGTDLLVRRFGLDRLDLGLLNAPRDATGRQPIRDELALLVEVAKGDADAIREVSDAIQLRKERGRAVDRMREFGLAVQAAIGRMLEEQALRVKLVDKGFDFLVSHGVTVEGQDSEDMTATFPAGSHRVEVKATTSGEVKLTPLQALTASQNPSEFVLCVVDLRGRVADIDTIDWQSEDISSYVRMSSGHALPVAATYGLIKDAQSCDVTIRNEQALRYAVPAKLWTSGISLRAWVEKILAE